jgi:quinol monooxygenase YgiN
MIYKFLLAIILFITVISAKASGHSGDTAIFVIVHVDVMPAYARSAASLLDSLKYQSEKVHGYKSFKVLQEPGRTNHFTLVEEWSDMAAYDAYISGRIVRAIREKVQPMLGSPFDERIHIEVK